jgi:hypothetical protein
LLGLARLYYGVAGLVAVILAAGVVAPVVTGAGGGCQVVLSIGNGRPFGAGPGPTPQASAGPAVPGGAAACSQSVDVVLPLIAVILGVVLVATAIRLGRGAAPWGPMIAIGSIAAIVAAIGASYAILGIAASDQPQSSSGPVPLIIAALLLFGAIGSVLVVMRSSMSRRPSAAPPP